MYENIFFIPARSGSKGVIDKNIQMIGSRNLINWAVEFACVNDCLRGVRNQGVYLSTDSQEYLNSVTNKKCKNLGLRPKSLSGDSALTRDLIKDFLKSYQAKFNKLPHILTLLQPTSPLRTAELLQKCIDQCVQHKATVTTIKEFAEPHPHKLLTKDEDNNIKSFITNSDLGTPRQSLPKVYNFTGAIYCYWVENMMIENANDHMVGVEQEKFVNIDTYENLEYARYLHSIGVLSNV